MNFGEALEEMGLTASATREEIRRAYLKLLKTRKPDADKAAFMRLREAYELLTSRPARALEAPAFPLREPSSASDIPSTIRAETPQRELHPDSNLNLNLNTKKNLNPEASRSRTLPFPPYPTASPPADPSLFDPDTLLETLGTKPTVERYAEALQRCTREAVDPGFPLSAAIRLILLLQWTDKPASARRLIEACSAWMKATGSELRVLRSNAASMWIVARELAALGEVMPFEMKQPIAAAALDGDLSLAVEKVNLAAQVSAQGPQLRRIRVALARQAPSLHAVFGPSLSKVDRVMLRRAPLVLGLPLLFALIGYCGRPPSRPDAPAYSPPFIDTNASPSRERAAPSASTVGDHASTAVIPSAASSSGTPSPIALCSKKIQRLAEGPSQEFVRMLASDIPEAIDAERCVQAGKDIQELHKLVTSDALIVAIAECDQLIQKTCAARERATK